MNSSQQNKPKYAHPAEETFAKILNFYGVEWQYEPHTFPLEWDDQGNVTEAFTPDFYLPSQNLYIELTTLRPKLSTHKNWKLRRFNDLYPEINIKLLKRREMRDLMRKYGLEEDAESIDGTKAQNNHEE